MNIPALGGTAKEVATNAAKSFLSDYIASLGADATASLLFKDWGKRPGDKGLMAKVKELFSEGKKGEAVEVLLTARPSGEGQADEAISLNALLVGLRRYKGGREAAQADDLARYLDAKTPEERERFRLTWVLLDVTQRIGVIRELASMTGAGRDVLRDRYLKSSGIFDVPTEQQQLRDSNAELRARSAQRKQARQDRKDRPWYKKLLGIVDFS